MLTAKDIMTPSLTTIGPQNTIHDAIEKLVEHGYSGLPVTDDQGQLVGIVTEFAMLALAYDQSITRQTVAQHMTCEVITVDYDTPVNRIADLCIVNRVRRLPVLKDGKLVGLVARRDVLKALHEAEAPAGAC
ncbi:Hypoxic response protein 1 [Pseudobythopirellula maris]|uniref:Hypoxic response protein 1 n=1 Tax=Pseudobythopirellula maris TaxID=2527991 RepID=A0A5C5ZQT2_9BACT|nr:CBS domain-containing protein [Pseudobythopirellula maris]TWT89912.1 Hypoxic response protein 1 [Pseudobythopirellula maris]